jgi:5-methylphenazine-1-carboxylate 1-monooxygenase
MTTPDIEGDRMTVLIAGGGIDGLTLALSLHQIGIPAKVFESVSELKPLGVGINVLPHAVRELIELGLLEKLDASGVRTRELAYFSKHGKPIWSEPRGIEAGYHWPQFSIHRGTLQQILLDTAIERLGVTTFSPAITFRAGPRHPMAYAPISSTRRPASPQEAMTACC